MEAAAGSVKVHHKVKDLISSPHSPSVSSSWSTETHSSSRFSLIITQSTIHLDSPGVCSRVVPFRRLLEGSCLRRTRSVGSWSEKSVRDNLKKTKKNRFQPHKLFSCSLWGIWSSTSAHLAFAEGSYLLWTGGLTLLQPDAGTHLLAQPLILHSNHLGDEQGNKNASSSPPTVWRQFLISAALQWFPVSPAPPALWDVWTGTARPRRGRCSRLLGWSCPSAVLQCGSNPDRSEWPCHWEDGNHSGC